MNKVTLLVTSVVVTLFVAYCSFFVTAMAESSNATADSLLHFTSQNQTGQTLENTTLLQGQYAIVPIKASATTGYEIEDVNLAVDNVPSNVSAWIVWNSFPIFANGGADRSYITDYQVKVYANSGALPGNYTLQIVGVNGNAKNLATSQDIQISNETLATLHLFIKPTETIPMHIGEPEYHQKQLCIKNEDLGDGNYCMGFVAEEGFPITLSNFTNSNETIRLIATGIPDGAWAKLVPDNISLQSSPASATLMIAGAVKPFGNSPPRTGVAAISAISSNNATVSTGYVPIISTDNVTILHSAGEITFPAAITQNINGTNFTYTGVIYDSNTTSGLPVSLTVAGLASSENGTAAALPGWIKADVPISSFVLNTSEPYYFLVKVSTQNAPVGTYYVGVNEVVGDKRFQGYVRVDVINPISYVMQPAPKDSQQSLTQSPESPRHLISFGPSWHFAENETLPGTLGDYLCSIPPTPCPNHPIFTADKYIDNLGEKVDLVTRGEGHFDQSTNTTTLDSYDIVVVNSNVYCFSTNSTSPFIGLNQFFRCPSVINHLSPLYTVNNQYYVAVDNYKSYPLQYSTTDGRLMDAYTDIPSRTLSLTIVDSIGNGQLTLLLPRELIDSHTPRHLTPDCWTTDANDTRIYNYCDSDIPFSVSVNGNSNQTSVEKISSSIVNGTRLLIINYPAGKSTIKIQGTTLAPEFTRSLTIMTEEEELSVDLYGNATETVFISGNADNATAANPLTLQVLDPMNQSYASYTIPMHNITSDIYNYKLSIGEKLPRLYGTYSLIISHNNLKAQTTVGLLPRFPPSVTDVMIAGKTYSVWYGPHYANLVNLSANPTTNSLRASVYAGRQASIRIDIPRQLLNSTENGVDTDFTVMVNGSSATFRQVSSDPTIRSLNITLPEGYNIITIQGTEMVPEFNFASAVLVMGIPLSAVIIVRKYRGR